ncbi:unnamed protein product [Arabidopsis halleri]
MGAANLRRSLSPLHAEFEALLWAMKCMIGADNQEVAFLTDRSTGEDGVFPNRMAGLLSVSGGISERQGRVLYLLFIFNFSLCKCKSG